VLKRGDNQTFMSVRIPPIDEVGEVGLDLVVSI